MTPTEKTAFTATFLAAVVAVGLVFAFLPNIELITTTVFLGGYLLGVRRGVLVGAVGMLLYVLANTAIHGFPVSPLPLLVAQGLGMAAAGLLGALWRRRFEGRAPKGERYLLMGVGVLAATWNQFIVNVVSAVLFTSEEGYWVAFVGGMSWGSVQIVANALVFFVLGPGILQLVTGFARGRGWIRPAVLALLFLGTVGVPLSQAQDSKDPVSQKPHDRFPLWRILAESGALRMGSSSYLDSNPIANLYRSHRPDPAMVASWDRFGLGWNRGRFSYDGIPLSGAVHSWAEPPDLPIAWRANWSEKFSATQTELDLSRPKSSIDVPRSTTSLTTGTFGRRTTEFGLFRRIGGANLGVNLMDREEAPAFSYVSDFDATRIWVHLESVRGRRPDYSLDISDGSREQRTSDSSRLDQNVRRLQFSLRGPTFGGDTRIGIQLRRSAVKATREGQPLEEVLWDGYTLQGDWEVPKVSGLNLMGRFERDRRRGLLDEARTLDGYRLGLVWALASGAFDWGVEATGGHQEPWGTTWEGLASMGFSFGGGRVVLSVSQSEGAPPLVDSLERGSVEYGFREWLELLEDLEEPERARGARLEATFEPGQAQVMVGTWFVHQENYLFESNPNWVPGSGSPYVFNVLPDREADILGAYGKIDVPVFGPWALSGSGRVHNRDGKDVPYLPQFSGEGSLHWRPRLFSGSLNLDMSVGGRLVGERENPEAVLFPTFALGHFRLIGLIDNGVVSLSIENLADARIDTDFRSNDTVTQILSQGRYFILGLTMALTD